MVAGEGEDRLSPPEGTFLIQVETDLDGGGGEENFLIPIHNIPIRSLIRISLILLWIDLLVEVVILTLRRKISLGEKYSQMQEGLVRQLNLIREGLRLILIREGLHLILIREGLPVRLILMREGLHLILMREGLPVRLILMREGLHLILIREGLRLILLLLMEEVTVMVDISTQGEGGGLAEVDVLITTNILVAMVVADEGE
jgi:hypothetical protein